MVKVAVIKCDSYEKDAVASSVKRGIDLIGGVDSLFKSGEKIVLKPNILAGVDPQKCVTTHPVVFSAVIDALRQVDLELSFGDSPGFGKFEVSAQKAGLLSVAKEKNVAFADFDNGKEITFKKGIARQKFPVVNGVLNADGLVSISKLKAHALTRLTGAVKNQYGCIPGLTKASYHARIPLLNHFSQFIVDINNYIKPRLFVMDGIMAMEGNGPNSGDPRKVGVILVSTDPVALDSVACKIVNLDPEYVPTITAGMKSALGTYREDEIELVGDPIEDLVVADFDIVREPAMSIGEGAGSKFLMAHMLPRPKIDHNKCVKCGKCVAICPVDPKVLTWPNGDAGKNPPVYDYSRCIRCYCCQETCPEKAIDVYTPKLRSLTPLASVVILISSGLGMLGRRVLRFVGIGKKEQN